MFKFLSTGIVVIGIIIGVETLASFSEAFDYEHPEHLSAGECWRQLPNGRMVIRSGAECPEAYSHMDTNHQSASKPTWGNVGARRQTDNVPYGGSYQRAVPFPGTITERSQNPYLYDYSGERNDYPQDVDGRRWHHGRPFHPEPAILPPDQIIFQKIYKNAYPSPNTPQSHHLGPPSKNTSGKMTDIP